MEKDTVKIKLASLDEEYPADYLVKSLERVVTFGDYFESPENPNSRIKYRESTLNHNITLKRGTSVGMSGGLKINQPYAAIDAGADKELVGRDRRKLLNLLDKYDPLNGALYLIGTSALPKMDKLISVEDNNGNVELIVISYATYDRRVAQYKSL